MKFYGSTINNDENEVNDNNSNNNYDYNSTSHVINTNDGIVITVLEVEIPGVKVENTKIHGVYQQTVSNTKAEIPGLNVWNIKIPGVDQKPDTIWCGSRREVKIAG